MLGNLGYYSGKGMVLVPDLSGLSSSAAQSAITAAGLTVGSISSTSSGANSGNNGQVASSSPTTGTLVDYETSVSFVTYSYSPPPVVNPPVWIDSAISNYFQVNESYSDSVSASNGASYTWEYVDSENGASPAQFWPAGVSISNGSGVISGSPTTSGQAYSFRIAAYNTGGTIYSQTYSGNVNSSSTPSLTLSVDFNTPSSSTSLSGAIIADNTTTGASYSVTVSTNAGSISPTSFVVNGYSQVVQPFTVTGLSLGQTATVTASSTGVTASNSATTTSTGPTYRFESSTSGYPSPQSGESVSSEGSFVAQGAQIGTTVYVNAGNCGSNGIYIYAPQQWWWRCFVTN